MFSLHSDWVLDNSRNYILRQFETLKSARYNAHLAYLQTLPYYSLYTYHNGRPPQSQMHARDIHYLENQLHNARTNLRLGVDQDWRSVCLLYPDTLDYYFGLVAVRLPGADEERVLRPEIGRGKRRIRRDSGHSEKGKKEKGRA
jgi:hypothetical protein